MIAQQYVNTFYYLARQPLIALDWNSDYHFHELYSTFVKAR